MNRRSFLGAATSGALIALTHNVSRAQPSTSPAATTTTATSATQPDLQWHDARDLTVEGRGWSDTAAFYDRLPAKAKGVVRDPVWNLSRHSAGMLVRFETDAPDVHVRYTVTLPELAMAHMPATGVSGVDLYARDDAGTFRWVGVTLPKAQATEKALVTGMAASPGTLRPYLLYLPLYNGVKQLEIGVPKSATLKASTPRADKPIAYYGTSIAHGACASRPGMAFLAIVGRKLNVPTINLGFSGNGRMDLELADLIAEVDASVYAIDCLPNMSAEQVAERAEPFVRKLRAKRPNAPVVLVEDRTYAGASLQPKRMEQFAVRRGHLRSAFDELKADGDRRLYYVEGDQLLGADDEGTTDGSHPNDLGMMRQAEVLERVLRPILRPQQFAP